MMILWAIGYFVGLYLYFVIDIILSFIIGKITGMYMMSFSLFGKEGGRASRTDSFTWRKCRFSLIPTYVFGKPRLSSKEDFIYTFTKQIINILLFGGFFLYVMMSFNTGYLVKNIMRGMSGGTFMFSIVILLATLFGVFTGDNKTLYKLNRAELEKLWNGSSFSEINIYPGLAADKSGNKSIRAIQWSLCCYNAMEKGDYNALANYLRQMDEMLKTPNGYNKFIGYTQCYYHIIFYSSYINLNKANAIKFYDVIKERLESDMDPNGRRVLAYYQYYVLNRPDLAIVSINQAEEALAKRTGSDVFTDAEYRFEKKLIEEIKTHMANDSEAASGENPIIRGNFF